MRNALHRTPFPDAEKARARRIELKVVGADVSAVYRMPWSEAPVRSLGGLPADMLDGATLIVDEALIEKRRKGAVQAAVGLERDREGKR